MNRMLRPSRPIFTFVFVLTMLLGFAGTSIAHPSFVAHAATSGCQLNSAKGNIQHVIYIQFDNTHFTRDNPNVPSDLEQMPNLLNFIKSNGVLLSNHHTPLIAHTATDILTAFTGVYGDHHGVPISNSFRYFNPDGTSNLGVSFAYWTDPLFDPTTSTPTDTKYNMLTAGGMNAPAPWVPYTRAGCNFGGVATANVVLENTATDIPTVFGASSPQAAEVKANPAQAFADFVGVGVHCAQGNALCSSANTGEPDLLPQEPGGYTGYNGLFGNKYVAPQISPNGPMKDLNGNVIQDPQGHVGFPGFDGMSASVSLSYVAALQAYNDAFGKFFTRLANDGINSSNTLFVFTADEGDHFVGGAPSPAGCDGVTTPCTYSQIGELNGNMAGLLATEQNITTLFKVHSDAAPNVYITGNPARTDPVARAFERGTGKLTAANPITGNTDTLTKYLADTVEMKLLHMVTADPARTPTFTMFADPNYFLFAAAPNCTSPCITEQPGFAWNHGDVSPDINTTWLGMVGPGIAQVGADSNTWSDHTDIRPTMMVLLGLKDDYVHDGRVLFEDFEGWAVPPSLKKAGGIVLQLAQVYKQIDACVGQLGLKTLAVSTRALESGSASDDSTYTQLENQLSSVSSQRDALAAQIITVLEAAEFNGQPINQQQAKQFIAQGTALMLLFFISSLMSYNALENFGR